MLRFLVHLRHAVSQASEHQALTMAKAVAYSALVSLFPVLLVTAALLALSQQTHGASEAMEAALSKVLPPNSQSLVLSYLATTHSPMSVWQLILACVINFVGAAGVINTLMESFRRAYGLPDNYWSFWRKWFMGLVLIPLSLLPMTLASMVVVFGRAIEAWMLAHIDHEIGGYVLVGWLLARWGIALVCSVSVITLIYYLSTPRTHSWRYSVPGALLATLSWFVSTLAFGWYLTRFANYARVYGPLGAGVALLFWLYIISFCVIIGAEFNAQLFPKSHLFSAGRRSAPRVRAR